MTKMHKHKCWKKLFINYLHRMNVCYASIIAIAIFGIAYFILRKPSKEEIKKFQNKDQDKINWSKMGF